MRATIFKNFFAAPAPLASRTLELMLVRALLSLAAAAAVLAVAPAGALARSDASSAQAYVHANYALVRVARSHLAVSEAGPLHVLAQVKRECPGIGASSPQDSESTQMSDEVIGAMVISAAQPDRSAISAFVRAVASLRWSSHALTRAVRAYARDLQTVLSLPAPSLCADVKAWGADGYSSLPASTVAFVSKFMPAWVALGYLPASLARFESSAVKSLAQRCHPLENALTEGEARAVAHYGAIMNALVIWP
jgi:hypothetical protein